MGFWFLVEIKAASMCLNVESFVICFQLGSANVQRERSLVPFFVRNRGR